MLLFFFFFISFEFFVDFIYLENFNRFIFNLLEVIFQLNDFFINLFKWFLSRDFVFIQFSNIALHGLLFSNVWLNFLFKFFIIQINIFFILFKFLELFPSQFIDLIIQFGEFISKFSRVLLILIDFNLQRKSLVL